MTRLPESKKTAVCAPVKSGGSFGSCEPSRQAPEAGQRASASCKASTCAITDEKLREGIGPPAHPRVWTHSDPWLRRAPGLSHDWPDRLFSYDTRDGDNLGPPHRGRVRAGRVRSRRFRAAPVLARQLHHGSGSVSVPAV